VFGFKYEISNLAWHGSTSVCCPPKNILFGIASSSRDSTWVRKLLRYVLHVLVNIWFGTVLPCRDCSWIMTQLCMVTHVKFGLTWHVARPKLCFIPPLSCNIWFGMEWSSRGCSCGEITTCLVPHVIFGLAWHRSSRVGSCILFPRYCTGNYWIGMTWSSWGRSCISCRSCFLLPCTVPVIFGLAWHGPAETAAGRGPGWGPPAPAAGTQSFSPALHIVHTSGKHRQAVQNF